METDYTRRIDFDEMQFEQLVNVGIAAVKGGERSQARTLLHKAAEMKPTDPRPWLWLSATSANPHEQYEYLEYALAADPANAAARRGLALLSGKLDKSDLLPEGAGVQPRQPIEPEEARTQGSYLCPQCGGSLVFSPKEQETVCASCSHIIKIEKRPAPDEGEQVLDFVLPTLRGHRWAEARHRLACSQCDAISILFESERLNVCPYCGSSQFIESVETGELLSPHAIGLVKIDKAQAVQHLAAWLGSGYFIPDDLKNLARTSDLRAAYYPFWTFDGTLELHWMCEVDEGHGEDRWMTCNGIEYEMFDDVLVPGIKSLSRAEISRIEPFALKELVAYNPAFLAGWNTLAYDKSLAEAALDARERIVRKLRRDLSMRVLIGRAKRDLRTGETNWSGNTFKCILLPLWVGNYTYKDRSYRILINGMTGKVGGVKPLDLVKAVSMIILVLLSAVILLVIIALISIELGLVSL